MSMTEALGLLPKLRRRKATPPTGVMKIMDPTGHTEISWNAGAAAEVRVARAAFDKLTAEGYQAFHVGRSGSQGERMLSFDAEAEKILMIPQLKGG